MARGVKMTRTDEGVKVHADDAEARPLRHQDEVAHHAVGGHEAGAQVLGQVHGALELLDGLAADLPCDRADDEVADDSPHAYVVRIEEHDVETPEGRRYAFPVVRSPGFAKVVPITAEGDVILRGAAQGITPGTPVQYEAPR